MKIFLMKLTTFILILMNPYLTLMESEDTEPGTVRRGWQHEACSRVERQFREDLFAHALAQVKALVRSQGGVGAGAALSVPPISRETTLPSHLPKLFCCDASVKLFLCAGWCRCGRQIDAFGHHRAACAQAGVLN